ncbi:MAG TPA: hypothetical protein GX724_03685 [Fibrobacter sp.]|nr:hypothetical protein [Fibrobacter sp.]
MTSLIKMFGQCFWLGLLFWAGVFMWFRYVAYPIYLKKMIRSGKSWVYIPLWWNSDLRRQFWIKVISVVLMVLAIFFSASSLYWLLPFTPWVFLVGLVLFSLGGTFLAHYSIRYFGLLESDCYFLEYRRQLLNDKKEGKKIKDADIRNRTNWVFQAKLKRADEHGHFHHYIAAVAKSQKRLETLHAEALHYD